MNFTEKPLAVRQRVVEHEEEPTRLQSGKVVKNEFLNFQGKYIFFFGNVVYY